MDNSIASAESAISGYCDAVTQGFMSSIDNRYIKHRATFTPLIDSAATAVEHMMATDELPEDLSKKMRTAAWLAVNLVPIEVINKLEVALVGEAVAAWPEEIARAADCAKRVALDFYDGFWPFEHPAAATQAGRFGSLADHIPAPVFMANPAEAITYASPELKELLSITDDEAVGTSLHELFGVALDAHNDEPHSIEVEVDGTTKFLNVTLLSTATPEGNDYFGFVADRTREVHLEKMRDGVVGAISHELRTPLTAVIGYLELLASDALPPEEKTPTLDIISSEAQLLLRLVTDIVDFSNLASGGAVLNRSRFNVAEESQTAARRALYDSDVEVTLDVPAELMIIADRDRFSQLLTNLLTNARRYGGPKVTIAAREEAGDVVVAISDNGRGIPERELAQIFQPFVQGSDRHTGDGAGLGLAICTGIIESHGGTLSVTNDNGARFTARVPQPRRRATDN